VIKKELQEDITKAAKTPLMIYDAKLNDNILLIHQSQNECQWRVKDFWSCMMGNLHANQLRPFINGVLGGVIRKRASCTLPATF